MNDELTRYSTLSSSVHVLLGKPNPASAESADSKQQSLEHLLSTPIEYAINHLPRKVGDKVRKHAYELQIVKYAQETGINCFNDLFTSPKPPLEMLKFVKEFSKVAIKHGQDIWPRGACEAVYYASYAAALLCGYGPLGDLTREEFSQGARKLTSHSWIQPNLRRLVEQAELHLENRTS